MRGVSFDTPLFFMAFIIIRSVDSEKFWSKAVFYAFQPHSPFRLVWLNSLAFDRKFLSFLRIVAVCLDGGISRTLFTDLDLWSALWSVLVFSAPAMLNPCNEWSLRWFSFSRLSPYAKRFVCGWNTVSSSFFGSWSGDPFDPGYALLSSFRFLSAPIFRSSRRGCIWKRTSDQSL